MLHHIDDDVYLDRTPFGRYYLDSYSIAAAGALEGNHKSIFKRYIDISHKSDNPMTMLNYAAISGDIELFEYFHTRYYGEDIVEDHIIVSAIRSKHINMFKHILNKSTFQYQVYSDRELELRECLFYQTANKALKFNQREILCKKIKIFQYIMRL